MITLTDRDRLIVQALLFKVPLLEEAALARFWPDTDAGRENMGRRLRQLAGEGLLDRQVAQAQAATDVALFYCGGPGAAEPDFGPFAWRLTKRWAALKPRRAVFYTAAEASARHYGRDVRNPLKATAAVAHNIGRGAVWAHYALHLPLLASAWVTARAQSLLTALGLYYGDAYGKSFFQSVTLDTLTAFLDKFRDVRSFADLARYADHPGSYTATNTDQENSQHLRMLLRQLASVAPLNVNPDDRQAKFRPEVVRDAIDMADVLTEKQVVYFSLPSLEEELTAKSVAKLALYALVHAAKVVSRTRPTVPVYVFVDEFQQVCAENVKILLEMARSMGVYLVLSHQDVSQLKTADYDITSTVESCTTFKMTLEASSLAALRQMEEYSGVSRTHNLSWTQPVVPGLNPDADDPFSLGRAYPRRDFEPPTATVSEVNLPTLGKNEILAASAHPLRVFARSRSDSGLTQYAGQWGVVKCEFPTTAEEYRLRTATPWPSEHPSCVTVGEAAGGDDDEAAGPVLKNGPLPVPPPPKAVDQAIDDRLLEPVTGPARRDGGG